MSGEVGTIISSKETPRPEEFSFVLNQPVKQGQFVEFDTEEGRAIARVSNVIKTNRYFMEAESVSEYESSGTPLEEVLPTEDWEYLVGEGMTLGVYDDEGLIQRPSFPPSPGTDVFEAEEDRLKDFLGLDPSGLHIGNVQFHDLPAEVGLSGMFQKHLAILAQTGAGKSYLASVLLEELLDRDEEEGQLAVIAIDPHGEYAGFAEDSDYMQHVRVYGEGEIQIGMPGLSTGNLSHYFSDVSAAQKRKMSKLLSGLDDSKGVYGLEAVIEELEESDINQSTKEVWRNRLERMRHMGLFKQYDSPSMDEVESGKMLVLDLSEIVDRKKKQIITAHFTQQLFRARRDGNVPPFFLLVEEAHNFIPEGASSSDAPARGPITRIAREGRKFHASLGLISQRPARLSQTVLSQCNTNIILRITNPYDLDRIKQGSEGITSDVMEQIPGLRVGEGVVVGEAVNYPTFVSIRERNSDEFDTGKDLEEAAREFTEEAEQEDEDVEAFI
ncbi:MAG: ATP-binding protein [Candidatus Nanohaloarchaea archaeon]|nr:ATP-binding protein [Candidatus Nanohaloarchaea archaeon]